MSVLMGGRKARRRRSWALRLWVVAAALALVVGIATVVLDLS
jgi:hypothetical protein